MERVAKYALVVLFILLVYCPASARSERDYAEAWCAGQGGITEVLMPAGTRCDCLTNTHAVEVERAAKWAESIGQALHYAEQSERRAGVALIMGVRDERFWERLLGVIQEERLPIDVWIIEEEE